MNRRRQAGFAHLGLLVMILVLVGIVVFAGWRIHSHATKVSSQNVTTVSVPAAPSVSSASDLNTAATTLDQNDPTNSNSSDLNQLDSQLNTF